MEQVPNGPLEKIAVLTKFWKTKKKGTFQEIPGKQDLTTIGPRISLVPSMDPTGPWKAPQNFGASFQQRLPFLYYTLSPLTTLEQDFGHFENLPRLKGPSWTIKDLEMDYASRQSKSLEPGNLVPGYFWRKIRTFFRNKIFQDILSKCCFDIEKIRLKWISFHNIHA